MSKSWKAETLFTIEAIAWVGRAIPEAMV